MTFVRNPLLTVVCLVLLANLLFNSPQRPGMPHARRASFKGSVASMTASSSPGEPSRGSDSAFGQMLYASNCTACHGSRGHGMPRQGANLRESKFIAEHNDQQLIAFLSQGRTPADPMSTMGMLMPPRGGNRTLDNPALADIVAFLRELQDEARQETATAAADAASGGEAAEAADAPDNADAGRAESSAR